MIVRPYASPSSAMVHAQPSSTISRDRPFGLNLATSGDRPSDLCSAFRTARVPLLELGEGGGLSWVLHAQLAAHGRGAWPPSCRCARPSPMHGRSALEVLAVIFIMSGLHGSTPVLGVFWKIGVQCEPCAWEIGRSSRERERERRRSTWVAHGVSSASMEARCSVLAAITMIIVFLGWKRRSSASPKLGVHGYVPQLPELGLHRLIREATCLEDDPITGLQAVIAMLGLQGNIYT
ncbi:hypothetical protein Dimus_007626 [Dionaea muscipula]